MITLLREDLAEALKGFRLLKRKKGATKAPLAIRVESGAQTVRLCALCLDNTLCYTMPATGPHAAAQPFHLNMDHLEEAVTGADKKTGIRIDADERLIRYQAKGVAIEHAFHTVVNEPNIEADLPGAREIPFSEELMETIAEAMVCASTDEGRYILNGVHIARGEVAATNGRKLYRRKVGTLPLPEDGIILLLHPALKLFLSGGAAICRLGPAPKEESHDRRFQLATGPWTWSAFLVKGRYPNYHQVIPKEDGSRTRVEISREDALKLIEVLPKLPGMNGSDNPIAVNIEEGRVSVIAESDGPEKRVVVEITKPADGAASLVTRFNRTFLREALQQGFRVLAIKDELSPVIMEDREQSRIFLWMPLRPIDPAPAQPVPAAAANGHEPQRDGETNGPNGHSVPSPKSNHQETEAPHHNRLAPVPAGAATTERNRTTMKGNENGSPKQTNGSNGHHGGPQDPVAQAREGLTKLREMLRDLGVVVQEVNASLREAEKDHKALEKEHRSLRKNLRGLQALDV